MNTLRAGGLILEPQVAAHARAMFVVLSDPAIYEFENAPPESEAWLEQRFARLESRHSADGTEHWLNWVIRLTSGALAGYAQATVTKELAAYIAYGLASRFWRQRIGSTAVRAMLVELESSYRVHTFLAILKARNFRSKAFLSHLGFSAAPPVVLGPIDHDPDELLMYKAPVGNQPAA